MAERMTGGQAVVRALAEHGVDVAFGIPFLPFAMVVISIARPNLALVILLVIFFLWRTPARVIRAQAPI